MYLIDTSVLLRVQDEDDPRHEQCSSAIDVLRSSGRRIFVCTQVLAEFWVVLTRPRDVNGWEMEFDDAVEQMEDVRNSFPCLSEPPDLADRWQQVVLHTRTMGKPAHDAKLVALMAAHGITHLITLNPGDFARYSGLSALTPEQVLLR